MLSQSSSLLQVFVFLLLSYSTGSYCPDYDCPCGRVSGKTNRNTIHLTELVPCYNKSLASPRRCDSFVYIAAIQSLVYIATNLSLITNCCFGFIHDIPKYDNPYEETLPGAVGEIYDEINANLTVGGIIGPQNQELSELLSNITGHQLKKLTVSYSPPSLKLGNQTLFPNLYSTASSMSFLNKVRLEVLRYFEWRKVAVVAADSEYSSARNFYLLASEDVVMDLSFPGTFHNDPSRILQEYKKEDYRIFVAFMPFEISRFIICKAIRAGLTTSKHVWILPGIYDYLWWRDCTCDNTADKFCSCNDCTEEEMRQAIQGMIFVDSSNLLITNPEESEAQINSFHLLFNFSREIFFPNVGLTEEDRQYLLHSRAPNAYDAVAVWALAWHAAVEELLEDSDDLNVTCASITSNHARDSEILTEKMLEILGENVYCGVSGHYTYRRDEKGQGFGQAIITQFQDDSECTIGLYLNYNVTGASCPRHTLQPISSAWNMSNSTSLVFKNFSLFQINSSNLIKPCPYRWKNRFDGSYCPDCYTAPTDGVCRDEFCSCYNNIIKEWEIILSLLIMIIGIIIAILLLILNFYYRHNKHFKSSTPALNVIIIIGSIVMYLSVVPLVLSFTGNTVAVTEEERKILLPVSCELTKWLFTLGMVLILSTMLARNWRLYRIFHNSRIVDRKNLSNAHLVGIIILIILPSLVLLILSSSIAPSEYNIEEDDCTSSDVIDDFVTRKTITYTCDSSTGWRVALILYNLLLICGLIFFSYQNARIKTHFSQEGEFAARAVFVIFLFVGPGLAIDLILHNRYFWIRLMLNVTFPSIVLAVLFVPKLIVMRRDRIYLATLEGTMYANTEQIRLQEKRLQEIAQLKMTLSRLNNEYNEKPPSQIIMDQCKHNHL